MNSCARYLCQQLLLTRLGINRQMATIVGGKGTFMLAAHDKSFKLSKVEIGRPEPGPDDVKIELKYCGMCHSDLHTVNGEWGVNKVRFSYVARALCFF